MLSFKLDESEEATIDDFPWTVQIIYKKGRLYNCNIKYKKKTSILDNETKVGCGGSLLNERYVLTSKNCVSPEETLDWKPVEVRLGEWNIEKEEDCDEIGCADPVQNVSISKIRIHKKANLVLLKLLRQVIFTTFIKPVCLPLTSDLQNIRIIDRRLYVSGWGTSEQSGPEYHIKIRSEVKGLRRKRCESETLSNQFCVRENLNEFSCGGDSGGSVVAVDRISALKPFYFILGVASSFNRSSCDKESWSRTYTKITTHLNWIKQNIYK